MSEPILLSLGSVNVDFQFRVERRPDPGETLLGGDFAQLGRGKAANVAFLARRLGVPARLLARVGDDALSKQALQPLYDAGVDLSGVSAVSGAVTGIAMIAVPPDGKKTIILAANANQAWTRDDGAKVASTVAEAPLGSVLVADCEVPGFVVEQAVAAAARAGLTVVLDPSPADRVEQSFLPQVDAIVPNATEARTLTGITIEDVDAGARAARRLLERGVRAACVKLPDGGCVLASEQESMHVPPVPVEVVDATGAGDAFAGALAVALLERRPLREAVCFATAASHLAVTAYGSQPAYPRREQLGPMFAKLAAGARVVEPR